MNKIYLVVTTLICFAVKGQIINFPDPAFKNALVNTPCVMNITTEIYDDADTNNDGEIDVSEAIDIGVLVVSAQGITSLDGIENFQNLVTLNCQDNFLVSLDASSLPNILELYCQNNHLTYLSAANVGSELNCSNNQLDTLSFNSTTSMWNIDLSNNPLTHLDLGGMGVSILGIDGTQMTSLELNAHISTYLFIENNPNLQYINAKNGFPEMIDSTFDLFITNNPSLQYVCTDDFQMSPFDPPDEGIGEFNSWVSAINNPNVIVTTFCNSSPDSQFNLLTGNVKFDCGGSNANIHNMGMSVSQGSLSGTTYTNNLGNYFFYAATGLLTVTPDVNPAYFTATPPNFTYDFNTYGNLTNADFCLSPTGLHNDLDISIIPLDPARPGFDAYYKIIYKNLATQTQSGTINFTYNDSLLDFVSANPAFTTSAPGILSWSFANLLPLESREIYAILNVNTPTDTPPVNVDDVLAFTALITSPATDENPADNTFDLNQTVVGAYDPNDKFVNKQQISAADTDDFLYYVIRFQNTGTAAAINVSVDDMLSSNLDPSTLQIVSASHPCRSTLTVGNKLDFYFENITLPSMNTDEPGSHGYVAFKMKPLNSVISGDIIENRADIYFDYNSPITTNTVTTSVTALSTGQFTAGSFSMYPNPVAHTLNIKLADISIVKSISILNMLGQLVKSVPVTTESSLTGIDVADLHSGTYFIEVSFDKGKALKKLVKI